MMQLQNDPRHIWKFSMYGVLTNENFTICALSVTIQNPGYNFGPEDGALIKTRSSHV